MEHVENTVVPTQVSRSDLSDWSGAPVSYAVTGLDMVKKEDRVECDHLDYALRGYDFLYEGYHIPFLSYGPASAPLSMYNLTTFMKESVTFQRMMEFYEGVAYDAVEFRITCSNPKGISGGFVTGIYPFTIWNTSNFDTQRTYFDQNVMTKQHLMLSPQAKLVNFGSAEDVVFDVPWQYNTPYITRDYINTYSDTSTVNQLWPGTPVLYFNNLESRFVSSQTQPSQIKVFVKFNNLRFVGPSHLNAEPIEVFGEFESQSGVETLAPVVVPAMMEVMAATGTEIVDNFISKVAGSEKSEKSRGTYEDPQAVQLAYVGDSTCMGPPSTSPIFRSWGPPSSLHKLISFMSEPQYLKTVLTDAGTDTFYANPTAPRGYNDLNGPDQCCTYLRYFSQAASYWRGTIVFDFVIMGHPMVEVAYDLKILYPPWSTNLTNDFSQNSLLKGICSGVYRISVPMPYMVQKDHMSIIDGHGAVIGDIQNASVSMLTTNFTIVSTMLDAPPIIPISCWIRAGDDFEFLQPYAIGLGHVENSLVDLESQVGLPDPAIVFQTRAKAQLSTKQMVAFTNVEDFMNIWSRSLPYDSYDGSDEPIVVIQPGVFPYWYPQVSTDASHTLNVQNSWWVTNDYLSFYSSMFLYYKGSIGWKVLCKPGDSGFKYISLSSGDAFRQFGHNPFTSTTLQLPPKANFGYGTVATSLEGQPVLEMTVPLRSTFQWAFTNPRQMSHVLGGFFSSDALSGSVSSNVVLHVASSDLQDALYRKAGKDYTLAVRTLLPPPTLWMAKGYTWSS